MVNASSPATHIDDRRTRRLTIIALFLIVLLGAFFRFYKLGASGVGNDYYAATVKSMLTSWHNFFFVSYEPGGSVSVDKPPMGFWLEAASAKVFGLNGFALAFPNALAGALSILLVYYLVRKPFGLVPGLVAALVLACVPVTVAAERNNTIDGMLVFTLLLSAWAFWKSVEKGKLRYLLLGAVILGLAFNIKMLQAYMVLPGLYLLFLLGAKHSWWKRIVHLGLATLVLLVVSLAWVMIVDSTPAADRPYVGSSTDNTVLELIIGHNGVERLTRGLMTLGDDRPNGGQGNAGPGREPPAGMMNTTGGQNNQQQGMPDGLPPEGTGPGNPPEGMVNPGVREVEGNRGTMPGKPGGMMGPGGGGMDETGKSGLLRLFTSPLAAQSAWLLPFAILGMVLVASLAKRINVKREQWLGLLLWAGWLIPMVAYFSFTTGLWHTYYLIMLGPGIAGLTGATFWLFDQLRERNPISAGFALTVLSAGTIGFQIYVVSAYPTYFQLFAILLAALWAAALLLYWFRPRTWRLAMVFIAMTIAPLMWSGLTAVNPNADTNLPRAEPIASLTENSMPLNRQPSSNQQTVLDYLLKNTEEGSYLVAGISARETSSFILSTDRPVLTFGGFGGDDNVVDVSKLEELVNSGKLRFVLGEGDEQSKKTELFTWVKKNCRVVEETEISGAEDASSGGGSFGRQRSTLYDCKK
jgi:4-amino-4-deoxy-L-arabinose transferase-like glycosyltransferase